MVGLMAGCASGTQNAPDDASLSPYFEEFEQLDSGEKTAGEIEFDGTLQQYVAYALRNHPQLRADYEEWRAATYRPDAAYDWPNPRLTYGYFIQSVETRVGPQRHRIGLMQPIPWPGKLDAMRDAARADTEIGERRYAASMLEVRREAAEIYWSIWAIDRQMAIQKEQIQIAETLAGSLRGRVETGRASLADMNQVELTISRMHDMVSRLAQKKRALEARLASALGLAESTVEGLPVRAEPPATAPIDEARIQEWRARVAVHPSLESVSAMGEKKRLMAESATAQKYPDFALGVDYIETGDALNPDMEDSGKDPVIAMITVELPIFSSSESAEVDAFEAEARSLESKREAMRQKMVARVTALASVINETHRRVELYTNTLIPQAEAAYTSVQSAYEVGQNQIASVLLALRDLLELESALVEARATHARARVDIEALISAPIQRP